MICWGRNQKGEIYFLFNFGCLKCWVMFGDIEYNIYFLMMPRGRKIWYFFVYDIFESIGELSYLAIKYSYIYWLIDNT